MQVRINGTPREIPERITVAGLLEELDAAAQRVAVEVNRELVPRREFEQAVLHEGDTVEIVTFVGGG